MRSEPLVKGHVRFTIVALEVAVVQLVEEGRRPDTAISGERKLFESNVSLSGREYVYVCMFVYNDEFRITNATQYLERGKRLRKDGSSPQHH